jgi:hypothetical protein
MEAWGRARRLVAVFNAAESAGFSAAAQLAPSGGLRHARRLTNIMSEAFETRRFRAKPLMAPRSFPQTPAANQATYLQIFLEPPLPLTACSDKDLLIL